MAWRQFLFLIIPLLIWNIIQICLIWHTDHFTVGKAITELGIWPTFHNANHVLWFLDELAWLSLFLPLIHRIPLKIRAIFIIFTLWAGNLYWPESWSIPKTSNVLAFFFLGTILHSVKREQIRHFFHTYAWVPASLALAYFFHPLFSPIQFALPNIHHSPLYSVVGCICILSYGATLERFFPKIAGWLASHAPAVFFIYAAHIPAFTLYSMIAKHFDIPELPPQYHPIYSIIVCIGSIIIFKAAAMIGNRRLLAWVFLNKKINQPESPST